MRLSGASTLLLRHRCVRSLGEECNGPRAASTRAWRPLHGCPLSSVSALLSQDTPGDTRIIILWGYFEQDIILNQLWIPQRALEPLPSSLWPASAGPLPWLASRVVRPGWELFPHSVLPELALHRVGVDAVPLQADGRAVQDSDFNVSGCSPGICNALGQRAG